MEETVTHRPCQSLLQQGQRQRTAAATARLGTGPALQGMPVPQAGLRGGMDAAQQLPSSGTRLLRSALPAQCMPRPRPRVTSGSYSAP